MTVTVDQYHQMIELGVFATDDRFELLEGSVVSRPTRDPKNATAMQLVREMLRMRLPPGWHTRTQSGFTTSDSEPEPAAAVVRGEATDYLARHPGPSDAALVVEVSNARLDMDRMVKGRLYARAGVAVYWIVNVADGCVETYCEPSASGADARYVHRKTFGPGECVPLCVDGLALDPIPVNDLVP